MTHVRYAADDMHLCTSTMSLWGLLTVRVYKIVFYLPFQEKLASYIIAMQYLHKLKKYVFMHTWIFKQMCSLKRILTNKSINIFRAYTGSRNEPCNYTNRVLVFQFGFPVCLLTTQTVINQQANHRSSHLFFKHCYIFISISKW